MTEKIDLDELETESESDADAGNDGDWLWRDDTDQEPPDPGGGESDDRTDSEQAVAETAEAGASEAAETSPKSADNRVPHVPYDNKGNPAGIPVEGGGSGAGAGRGAEPADHSEEGDAGDESADASGPHGRDADDMTLAMTYEAAKRLEDPAYVVVDAGEWADWLGIVGDVPAHVLNRFQREHTLDLDFFNGSGTGPRERLAEIDHHSMFYAERFVLVGVPGEEEWVPEGWEFLPLEEAAEKAGWGVE